MAASSGCCGVAMTWGHAGKDGEPSLCRWKALSALARLLLVAIFFVSLTGFASAVTDSDSDGVLDFEDNCPSVSNADQANNDNDALGDVCDDNDDNDVVSDISDNCPFVFNDDQTDIDSDGRGDACDPADDRDSDGDGLSNSSDNCPNTPNADQIDTDADGRGDACEIDVDGDGSQVPEDCDDADAFVHPGATEIQNGNDDDCDGLFDEGFEDQDSDGVLDSADNCPLVPNLDQANANPGDDNVGDACDDQWTVSLSITPASSGTAVAAGAFVDGTSHTFVATPNAGYRFVKWTQGGVQQSAAASYTFAVTANRNLVANFVRTYTVAVSASPPTGGTVIGGGTFPNGSSRTATATAKPGYEFARWTQGGVLASNTAGYTFTLNANRTLVAQFRDPRRRNDLLVDFGTGGLRRFLNNATWTTLHIASPVAIAAGDLDGDGKDEAIASFSGGGLVGLYARYNNTPTWTKLESAVPALLAVGDFDGNGKDDLAADFGAAGIKVLRNNTKPFASLNLGTSQGLATGDLDGDGRDELLADRGNGLWVLYNNGVTWTKIDPTSRVRIAVGDFDGSKKDDVVVDRGSAGIFVRYNNAGAFTKINATGSEGLAPGDLDGNGKDELIADFGANGLSARYNNATWKLLDARNPIGVIAADLDKSGKAEAIADFGATGLFARYNNAGAFVNLRASPEQGMAFGGFD